MSQIIEYSHVYKYRKVTSWPGLYPMFPVELRYSEIEVLVDALLDSGALYSCFDAQIATGRFGIDLSKQRREPVIGIGSTDSVYIVQLGIKFGPLNRFVSCHVRFKENLPANLLGRVGAFEHLQIGFDEAQSSVYMALNP